MTSPPSVLRPWRRFFLHVVPVWISYVARWHLLPPCLYTSSDIYLPIYIYLY